MESTKRASTQLAALVLVVGLLISSLLASTLELGLAGDPAVATKDKKKTDQQKATAVAEEFDPQRDYDQTQASDEIRAYHGAIFIARATAGAERRQD
jgi:hypothetical protein